MKKREVAEYLNLSTRAIERAVARGKLSVRYSKQKHGNMAIFDPVEVGRYKKIIELPPQYRPAPLEPDIPVLPDKQSPLVLGTAVSLQDNLVDMSGDRDARAVPISQMLTLSLAQAALLSGLSVSFLLNAIRERRLAAFEHGEDLRIKRADLDVFIQAL